MLLEELVLLLTLQVSGGKHFGFALQNDII